MKTRDFLTYFAKEIKKEFPRTHVIDSQAKTLSVGDFYIGIKSVDRDNKLTNDYIERYFQDTSVEVIYYCGKEPDTTKVNEVHDALLDIMQWVELDGRRTRARDCQITYGENCIICVAKYYNHLVRLHNKDDELMNEKLENNFVEEV